MKISVISFTENGIKLSLKLKKLLKEIDINLYTKCSRFNYRESTERIQYVDYSIGDWTKIQMAEKNVLLFIGACGIAVRAIAPHVVDKLQDSPVLVMDEQGTYIIPILSGHIGGANEIAYMISVSMKAVPVITTATDIQNKFAVDIFSKKNHLLILNKDGIAKVSSKVLVGEKLKMSVEPRYCDQKSSLPKDIDLISYPPMEYVDIVVSSEKTSFPSSITLKPKEYVIGMGCRRGKDKEKIEEFIKRSLEEIGIDEAQVRALVSVEQKREEQGFLAWSKRTGIPFVTFTADELNKLEGCFHGSDFVKEKIGVDNVCERAALHYCENRGKLFYEKHAEAGMTIAIAKGEWSVVFDEE